MDEVPTPRNVGTPSDASRPPNAVRDVTFGDRWVYLADPDVLVIADTHIGRGPTTNVAFPLGERDRLVDRLRSLLDRHAPATVIVAGDLLDSFGSLPRGVDETVASLVESAASAGVRFVVTPGNHDTMLDVVYDGERSPAVSLDDGTVVAHGHEPPPIDGDRYVIGHDHPAIGIEGQKRPCFLDGRGTYRGADVLVLPAFNRMVAGVPVNGRLGASRPELSPLVTRVGEFRPVVWDDDAEQALDFPPLGQFERML